MRPRSSKSQVDMESIEPLCEVAFDFLKRNVLMPSLGTVTHIGEITEIEWTSLGPFGVAGSIFVTNEEPRVVGFKKGK